MSRSMTSRSVMAALRDGHLHTEAAPERTVRGGGDRFAGTGRYRTWQRIRPAINAGLTLLLALLLGACGGAREPITVSGASGLLVNSEPFDAAGNYLVAWNSPRTDCAISLALASATDQNQFQTALAVSGASGTNRIYSVAAGRYYVSSWSDCEWRVTLTPV